MEQAQHSNGDGNMRIEHILRAADQVMSRKQRNEQIDAEERLKDQQSARLPREDQRTLKP